MLECPLPAISRHAEWWTRESALPPKADIETTCFRANSTAINEPAVQSGELKIDDPKCSRYRVNAEEKRYDRALDSQAREGISRNSFNANPPHRMINQMRQSLP